MNRIVLTQVRRVVEDLRRNRSKQEVTVMEVSHCNIIAMTPQLNAIIEPLSNLQILCLLECQLQSLDPMPRLRQLVHLDLTDNCIPDSQVQHLRILQQLQILNLGLNRVAHLPTLQQLAALPHLAQLELYENPIAQLEEYRTTAFQLIPHLVILDAEDSHGRLIEDQDDYEDDLILQDEEQGQPEDEQDEPLEQQEEGQHLQEQAYSEEQSPIQQEAPAEHNYTQDDFQVGLDLEAYQMDPASSSLPKTPVKRKAGRPPRQLS